MKEELISIKAKVYDVKKIKGIKYGNKKKFKLKKAN